jgi:MFS superfamily sulfate permease-like transporter
MKNSNHTYPAAGLAGLKQNWKSDIISGFMVFLIALPLSLGIAKASGFPPAMGVLTAIVGGLFTSLFNASALTIKGPAAGLITVCSAAILEFSQAKYGGAENAMVIVATIIMVMALLQIIFGFLKFGSLSDFFPHSAVHGMLAAIGIIIIAKQIPVLLGADPSIYKGESPFELLINIPKFITHAHWQITIVGILAITLMFLLPKVKNKYLKKIPAPIFVLVLAIPIAVFWRFKSIEGAYSLVSVGDFWGSIGFNYNFNFLGTFAFWKYVFMFLFVSSLESLLTVKAADNLDPYKRTSNYNGDLKAQGLGNFLSGLLGGLPMISEVVRSSSNINFKAKTKWSNFFHGAFLLFAMLVLIPIIEMIPNAALAAMLIYAGFRLAAPKEFANMYQMGKEQLFIFIVTIIVTLMKDLLLGIAAGILVKLIFHLANGAKLSNLFNAKYQIITQNNTILLKIKDAAIFSNLIGFKKMVDSLDNTKEIIVDLSQTKLIDHSFLTFFEHCKNEALIKNEIFRIIGLENHIAFSKHPLATRKLNNSQEIN